MNDLFRHRMHPTLSSSREYNKSERCCLGPIAWTGSTGPARIPPTSSLVSTKRASTQPLDAKIAHCTLLLVG